MAQTQLVVIRGRSFYFSERRPEVRVCGGKGRLEGASVLAQTQLVVIRGRSFCFSEREGLLFWRRGQDPCLWVGGKRWARFVSPSYRKKKPYTLWVGAPC